MSRDTEAYSSLRWKAVSAFQFFGVLQLEENKGINLKDASLGETGFMPQLAYDSLSSTRRALKSKDSKAEEKIQA